MSATLLRYDQDADNCLRGLIGSSPYQHLDRKSVRLRNELRNSILMTCHYPDLSGAFDWLNQISHAARPIRSTTQIWVVTRHQYGISALVSQTSFCGETSGSVAKCRLISQASVLMRPWGVPNPHRDTKAED